MREIFDRLYATPWPELPNEAKEAWNLIRYGHRANTGNHFAPVIPPWDDLTQEQRQIVVSQYDAQHGEADEAERQVAFKGGYAETVRFAGNAIDWRYWGRLRTLTAHQFSCLASALDPDSSESSNNLPIKAGALKKAKAIERLAINDGLPEAEPSAWLVWANKNRSVFHLHRPFRLVLEQLSIEQTGGAADGRTPRNKRHQGISGDSEGKLLPGDEWKEFAVAKANEIGLKRWQSGQRQISARSISKDVEAEMAKEENLRYWGTQGPRTASNIRNEALKGWKFRPPDPA